MSATAMASISEAVITATAIAGVESFIHNNAELHDDDRDSTLGLGSSTTTSSTISSSVLDYSIEHGRSYHAYKSGRYFLPNDEEEKDRLDLQYDIMLIATGDKLLHAPIHCVSRILELGTGTGVWAFNIADLFPEAAVVGVDLSVIQPPWMPPNVRFYVDDVEANWTYREGFDVIYSQSMLAGSIADKVKYFEQAYE